MDMSRGKGRSPMEIMAFLEGEFKRRKKAAAGETEQERDARVERIESSWAQASFSPGSKMMIDGTVGIAKSLVPPPKTAADALAANFDIDTHTVVAGETWSTIAPQYGVSVESLQAANPRVHANRLVPGARLTVPNS